MSKTRIAYTKRRHWNAYTNPLRWNVTPYRSPGCADVLCGARADVTDFSYMTLIDKSAVKHNMLKMACKNMRPIWRWLSLGGIITQGQLPQLSRNYIQNGMAKLFPEYKVAIRKEWVTYEHDQEILLWPRPANSVLDFEETSSRRKTQQACKEATRN